MDTGVYSYVASVLRSNLIKCVNVTGRSSSVERWAGGPDVAGSIPVTPTENESAKVSLGWLCAGRGYGHASGKPKK